MSVVLYANLANLIRAEQGLPADTEIYFRPRPITELLALWLRLHRYRLARTWTTEHQRTYAQLAYWHWWLEDQRQAAYLTAQLVLVRLPRVRNGLRLLDAFLRTSHDF